MRAQHRHAPGFTLVELVTVIVIIGIVSVGVLGFLRSSSLILVDVTERDQLLSDSRFVVQRMLRELRGALPNSVRLDSSGQCVEFVPVLWGTHYFDIPALPDAAANQFDVVTPAGYQFQNGDQVIVYPTSTDDVYRSSRQKRYTQASAPSAASEANKSVITLSASVQFAEDSPASRVYFIRQPVAYCLNNQQLYRYEGYGFLDTLAASALGNGVLMAENLMNGESGTLPFRIQEASLERNGSVLLTLLFELGDERIAFSNEVHLANVP